MSDIDNSHWKEARFPRRACAVALFSALAAFAVVLSGHSSGFLQRLDQGFTDVRTALFSDRVTGDYPDIVVVSVGDGTVSMRLPLASYQRIRMVIELEPPPVTSNHADAR